MRRQLDEEEDYENLSEYAIRHIAGQCLVDCHYCLEDNEHDPETCNNPNPGQLPRETVHQQ
jgi:hypothetical protein